MYYSDLLYIFWQYKEYLHLKDKKLLIVIYDLYF